MKLSKIPHLRHSGGELAPYSDTGPESIPGEVYRHNLGDSPSMLPVRIRWGIQDYGRAYLDVQRTDADASNAASIHEESVLPIVRQGALNTSLDSGPMYYYSYQPEAKMRPSWRTAHVCFWRLTPVAGFAMT